MRKATSLTPTTSSDSPHEEFQNKNRFLSQTGPSFSKFLFALAASLVDRFLKGIQFKPGLNPEERN